MEYIYDQEGVISFSLSHIQCAKSADKKSPYSRTWEKWRMIAGSERSRAGSLRYEALCGSFGVK